VVARRRPARVNGAPRRRVHPLRAVSLPTADDLAAAREVVARHLAPTPLVNGLKLETLQPTGSFKVRGAINALANTPADERVVTASAGNHGLGVAWAAVTLGRRATIVVPETASPAKLAALERIGADVVKHGDGYADAEAHALELDGRFVSAYNDRDVIAGQATIGAELPDGPVLAVCAIGGGGLLAGLVLWAKERGDARVIGVEAAASRAVSAAARAGHTVEVDVLPTLADGLAGNIEPGSVTPQVAREADALVAVEEDAIEDGIRALAREHGVVAEGAGAVPYAAVRQELVRPDDHEQLVVVVSGRNIALDALSRVLAA
jgi:threonine dehydratase